MLTLIGKLFSILPIIIPVVLIIIIVVTLVSIFTWLF